MFRSVRVVFATIVATLFCADGASAINLGGSAGHFRKARASFLHEGAPALAPMGHVMFCVHNPQECRKPALLRVARVELTDERMVELRRVNDAVNAAIRPRYDRSGPGIIDQWNLAPAAGDCEDYAITKRHRLIEKGWPASTLRLAVGYTAGGEGHAVLVVKTKSGDLVLDNRTDGIRQWHATDIRWVSIQSGADPRFWRSI